ncbi:E3 ubiquitin-protein ligase FANCL [Tupaia chinensis]|uniref:E3 ubiquitin-protein ligase FANCL n=1 Tax=Tupaia chinensis TaxID=246437 RepID=L9JC03_TUPCH|nr:E3 ubiquitin-protein ligase FANCL [Tupaia chinensis]
MAGTDASLLRECPLLLPQNRAKTVYEGFISAQGRDFHLRILLPEDLQLKNARLVYVDTYFSTIKLKAEDASGREHLITLKLKAKYPAESPDCSVDFPVPFSVSWTPQWLRGLLTSRQSFNILFGECPYCSKVST